MTKSQADTSSNKDNNNNNSTVPFVQQQMQIMNTL
jgi:hypothetical protein